MRLLAALTWLGLTTAQTLSGLSFDAKDVVSLMWAFDGQSAGRYDFDLCAGDESTGSYESLERVITDSAVIPGDLISFRVNRKVGGNDPNAYFLKVSPTNQSGKWSGFTSHFTLTNMQGTFSSSVTRALASMQPLPLPLLDDELLSSSLAYNASQTQGTLQYPLPTSSDLDTARFELRKRLAVDPHTVPYGEQTGLTKYAPMPKMAGSTIKAGSPTPQYPPFPFVKATTWLPAPTVQYTDTAYLTWTTHSIENTAAPAAAPTLDKRMQRWLERWQD